MLYVFFICCFTCTVLDYYIALNIEFCSVHEIIYDYCIVFEYHVHWSDMWLNVRVAHRSCPNYKLSRVLLKFGNGRHEDMTFKNLNTDGCQSNQQDDYISHYTTVLCLGCVHAVFLKHEDKLSYYAFLIVLCSRYYMLDRLSWKK